MKKRITILKAAAVCAFVVSAGCSEVNVCIGTGGSSGSQPDGTTLVTFQASVEGRNALTRAMTPIDKDVKVQMFAYSAGGASNETLITSGQYESLTPGMLSGVNDYKMYLVNGAYDFYGVSENISYAPVSFVDGLSRPLYNGVDYLWWGGKKQDVSSTQLNVPIVLLHTATQVSFEVTNGNGVQSAELVSATITSSEPGAQMNLFTGDIPSATGYAGVPDKMGINGNIAQAIMLPLKTTTPMKAVFEVRVNGENAPRTYPIDVPVPDGMLAAGDSYRFKIVISGSEISFDSVNVRSWVDVDEMGKPLYPTE